MKTLSAEQSLRRRSLLRFNILAGLLVFVLAVILMLSGEYTSLQERQSADRLYNAMAIGSLIYMSLVWMACVLTKPFWFTRQK